MARTKQTARRGKPLPVTSTVGFHERWPTEFISELRTLLADHEVHHDEASEPPAKRVKRSGGDLNALLFARETIDIGRKCPGDLLGSATQLATYRDVGSLLRVRLRYNEELSIESHDKSKSYVHAIIPIHPNEITERVKACMNLFGVGRWGKTDEEGEMWVTLDLALLTRGDHLHLELCFSLYWNETKTPYSFLRTTAERRQSQKVLDVFLSDDSSPVTSGRDSWSPLDFYEAAHVPPLEDKTGLGIEIPELTASLYPYQKKTLNWLLNREGVRWKDPSDALISFEKLPAAEDPDTAHSFRKIRDDLGAGRTFYVSSLYHLVTTDLTPFQLAERSVKGGILAEEMGLGKTLEVIGLVALHRRHLSENDTMVTATGDELLMTGATLIVTPDSLRQQWISEIQRHAPHLKVKFYPGRKNAKFDTEELLRADLASQDIVITTYPVLSSELHYALKPPERSRRQERKYDRPESPLTKIHWWRVCLDEAQMIESGVTGAAAVAKILPRVNSWGVTGTPVKNDVKDLFGLLDFLRYEPYASSTQVWRALTGPHKPLFRSLFGSIALRHTKQLVRHEIAVPPQKRFVITLPFTAVEEQYYGEQFKNMAKNCGLDLAGVPLNDEWKLAQYETEMRTWLNRLRQAALHPEIVQRRGNGRKVGPMRTVDEVLDAMLEQGDNDIRTEQRAYLQARLLRGQMLENGPRVREALAIWEKVKRDASTTVADCRQEMEEALKDLRTSGSDQETAIDLTSGDGDEDETDELSNTGRVGEARAKLRHALDILHKATFFCANALFQVRTDSNLTQPESDEFKRLQELEDVEYVKAQEIRREILSESHGKAMSLIKKLERQAQSQSFVEISELVASSMKGLESASTIEMLEELYGILNEQANVIDEWREALIKLLSEALIDEEQEIETTGEEFTDSTKIQEEIIVHVQVLRAVIADRQDAISGLENALVKHETRVSLAAAEEGDGPAPEKLIALYKLRNKVKPVPDKHGSLRRVIADLRGIASRLEDSGGRAGVERDIVMRQIRETQAHISAQTKTATALEREIDRFTSAMNARVEYYRQLQAVSDSVAPYEGQKDQQAIDACIATEDQTRSKLDAAKAKHRYLLNLKEAGTQSNEPRMCIICQSPFTTGVLTVCGHQFCKDCMKQWYRAHRNCPMCKRKLRLTELHDITLKPREVKINEDTATATSPGENKTQTKKTNGIYLHFGSEKVAQINDIELSGMSYGTKVDSICRHILWLRESDPGAKSIIFTQYRSFLGILSSAFNRYKIGYSSIDSPTGIQRFKENAGTEVFMLHGRAQSSGLNLVNASHVFLCEPLLNTALELQAIARVDRIGQKNETTVWLYLIEGSVEESIYNLSVKRRMEHMGNNSKGKSKESSPEVAEPTLEAANTLELEKASLTHLMSKDKNAGEAVEAADLWECLFGRVTSRITTSVADGMVEYDS